VYGATGVGTVPEGIAAVGVVPDGGVAGAATGIALAATGVAVFARTTDPHFLHFTAFSAH